MCLCVRSHQVHRLRWNRREGSERMGGAGDVDRKILEKEAESTVFTRFTRTSFMLIANSPDSSTMKPFLP